MFLTQMGSRSAKAVGGFPGAVTLLNGPVQPDNPDGPGELHLVIVDNGRSALLATPFRDVLACIGCGACHNVCPVNREIMGEPTATTTGTGRLWFGPLVGAMPSISRRGHRLHPRRWQPPTSRCWTLPMPDLPLASTLWWRAPMFRPVGIDLPEMLRSLREQRLAAKGEGPVDKALRRVPLGHARPGKLSPNTRLAAAGVDRQRRTAAAGLASRSRPAKAGGKVVSRPMG